MLNKQTLKQTIIPLTTLTVLVGIVAVLGWFGGGGGEITNEAVNEEISLETQTESLAEEKEGPHANEREVSQNSTQSEDILGSVLGVVSNVKEAISNSSPIIDAISPNEPTIPTEPLDKIKLAVTQVIKSLATDDVSTFYNMLSSDITSNFTQEEVSSILQGTPDIKSFEVGEIVEFGSDDGSASGGWAETVVTITLENGTEGKFWTVLVLENGEWKLFGTEEL